MKVAIILCIALVCLVAQADSQEKNTVLVDRVGDIGFIQLQSESFKALDARQQQLAYWLTQASIAIDPIIYDQLSRYGLQQKRLLEEIVAHSQGIDPSETRDDVWQNIDFIYTLERRIPESMRQYLYYYVGTRFRVEPYARVFRKPEAYGIAVEPYSMDIPARAECLGDSLKRIQLGWNDQLSSEEKELRYQLYLRHHYGSSITSYFKDYSTPLELNDQLMLSQHVEISEVKRGGTHRYRLSNLNREVPLSEVGYRILQQIQQTKKVGDILEWARGVYPGQARRVRSSLMRFLDYLVQSELVGFSLSPSMIADKQALGRLCLPKKHSARRSSSAKNVESQCIENFNDLARAESLGPS